MATFGFTATPTFGFVSSGTQNSAAMYLGGFPSPGGYVNQISVYARTFTGTATFYFCIWDASANLLFSTTANIDTNLGWLNSANNLSYYIPAGTNIFVGLQTPSANGIYIEYASSSGNQWELASVASIPSSYSGWTSETGEAMGAYVTYTPLSAPTVTNVTPNPAIPGQGISITGTSFAHATGVTIGGVAASGFTINSDTSISATLASNTPGGTQGVVVTNPAGSNAAFNITVGGISYCNTGTPGAPVWTQGIVAVNTGTPASPVWTIVTGADVNTGTPGSPIWTPSN